MLKSTSFTVLTREPCNSSYASSNPPSDTPSNNTSSPYTSHTPKMPSRPSASSHNSHNPPPLLSPCRSSAPFLAPEPVPLAFPPSFSWSYPPRPSHPHLPRAQETTSTSPHSGSYLGSPAPARYRSQLCTGTDSAYSRCRPL